MRLILVIMMLLVIFSCQKNKKVPADILEPQKMEKLMTDMLMAESFSETYLLLDTSKKRDEWFTGEMNKVLAIQHVSQDQFRKSLQYYKSRPDLLKVIIDTINAKAVRNRDKIYETEKKTRMKVE